MVVSVPITEVYVPTVKVQKVLVMSDHASGYRRNSFLFQDMPGKKVVVQLLAECRQGRVIFLTQEAC